MAGLIMALVLAATLAKPSAKTMAPISMTEAGISGQKMNAYEAISDQTMVLFLSFLRLSFHFFHLCFCVSFPLSLCLNSHPLISTQIM